MSCICSIYCQILNYIYKIELKECESIDNNLEDIILPNNNYVLPQVRHE